VKSSVGESTKELRDGTETIASLEGRKGMNLREEVKKGIRKYILSLIIEEERFRSE